jgi:hypothetical protein
MAVPPKAVHPDLQLPQRGLLEKAKQYLYSGLLPQVPWARAH